MTARSVIHDRLTIERTYPATPSRVFAAFASEEAKNAWGDTGDLEPVDGSTAEFDFRVGGRERFSHKWQGTTYRYDALYYDIVLLRHRAGSADRLVTSAATQAVSSRSPTR